MSLVERRRSYVPTISTVNKYMVIYLMTANVFIDDGMTLIRPLRKNKFYLHKMGIKTKFFLVNMLVHTSLWSMVIPLLMVAYILQNNTSYNAYSIVQVILYVENNIDWNMIKFIFNRNIIDKRSYLSIFLTILVFLCKWFSKYMLRIFFFPFFPSSNNQLSMPVDILNPLPKIFKR